MRSLSKLIYLEVIPPMIISLVIFVFVFLMRTIAMLAKMLLVNQYTLVEIGELLLYNIPGILGYVIPMSLLLGIILGINRLSSDSEIISLLGSGISPHSIMRPLLVLATVVFLFNAWVLMAVVPWANSRADEIVQRHASEVINAEVNPRIFNENFQGFTIYVDSIDSDGFWNQVILFDTKNPASESVILAQQARLIRSESGGSLDLRIIDYHSYTVPEADSIEEPKPASRGRLSTIKLVEARDIESRATKAKDERAQSIPELLSDIDERENVISLQFIARNNGNRPHPLLIQALNSGEPVAEKEVIIEPTRGIDTRYEVALRMPHGYEEEQLQLRITRSDEEIYTGPVSVDQFNNNRSDLLLANLVESRANLQLLNPRLVREKTIASWLEIHKKFALPFTCFVFAFLGLPLGISSRRSGKAYGYIVGIVIFIIFWSVMISFEMLASDEVISPALAAWAPNMIFGSLALLLFLRSRLQIRIPVLSTLLLRVRASDASSSDVYSTDESMDDEDFEKQRKQRQRLREESSQRAADALKSGSSRIISIVDRYVITNFVNAFLMVFITVYIVFSLVQYIDQNRFIQRNNVDPAILIDYFIYIAPENIYYILPISTLMGVMICFGLLSKNSEVTAFKSSGVSVYRLALPLLFMALLISLAAFYNQDVVLPMTSDDLAEVKGIIQDRPVQSVRNPTNRYILSQDQRSIYHFQQFDSAAGAINELQIYQFFPQTMSMQSLLYARRADWQEGEWISNEGWRINYDNVRGRQFDTDPGYPLPITETPDYFDQTFRPPQQMSYAELEDHIDALETYGLNTEKEEFELSWKLSFPFLPLVMTTLGLPFAFSSARRGGALAGVFISIGMVIIYWGIMMLFKSMGETGYLPALLAAWSPNIVFSGIGLLLFSTTRS